MNINLRSISSRFTLTLTLLSIFTFLVNAQSDKITWAASGSSYFTNENGELIEHMLPSNETKVLISKAQLTPKGSAQALKIDFYLFSTDFQKVLIFTNTKQVWRLNTRGDYWLLDLKTNTLHQLGKNLSASSLMFAKFSPDANRVAYVSENNIYVEDLGNSQIKKLTSDGNISIINGTFDWAYEEEFACRDGFRWSPDGKSIAYWQLDASSIKKFYMINNTDSIYPQIIPVEYPKVGQPPSSCKIGVVNLTDAKTTWIDLPGDPTQHYITRMEYIPFTNKILLQELNRKQNESKLYVSDINTGNTKVVYEEKDEAWVDIYWNDEAYVIDYTNNFTWLNEGKNILWSTEKDGWRHFYNVPLDGAPEKLVTKGNFDYILLNYTDTKNGYVYYMASPDNATQKYLYRSKLDGSSEAELLSPSILKGTHEYSFSADGQYAYHEFSNHFTQPLSEFVSVVNQIPLDKKDNIISSFKKAEEKPTTEFFKIKTKDNMEMDAWMVKPKNFDPKKKYPVVFYVYTEPGGATVSDVYGGSYNFLYAGDMADDGYISISIDNRGTPVPKGRAWRKSIYRKLGQVNIYDQAMAAKEILKWSFVDADRIAVWGWSGGGAATLNLMFQYPDIYKTGIAVASVSNQLTYDNIYQERYMGLPKENREDFIKGSPVTYAKNLKGNLLFIHGTADDNVHYQNAELLLNELIKHNKQFQFMPYPNRTHGITEGEGTFKHLSTLYTNYLKSHCPPGGK